MSPHTTLGSRSPVASSLGSALHSAALLVLIALLLIMPTSDAIADLLPAITPTRTSGPAPLAVVFDASQSKSTASVDLSDGHGPRPCDPFHHCHFSWDFGDSTGTYWDYPPATQDDKNKATGPIAAHVYETPGSYTVTLSVSDPEGVRVTTQTQITVLDPNAVFAGNATIAVCPKNSGDFTGSPIGATQARTDSWPEILAFALSGKRVLLRRGSTWTVSTTAPLRGRKDAIIGAFGQGQNPRLLADGTDINILQISGRNLPEDRVENLTIMDLDLGRLNFTSYIGLMTDGTADNVTLLRLNISNASWGLCVTDSILDWWNVYNQPKYPGHTLYRGWVVQDCKVVGIVNGGNGAYFAGVQCALLGNNIDNLSGLEHSLRLPHFRHGVISHNRLANPFSTKHCLKLHGPSWNGNLGDFPDQPGTLGYHQYGELNLVSGNVFEPGSNPWSVVVGPQDDSNDEYIRDIIIENNYFKHGSAVEQRNLYLRGQRMTVRNNVFDSTVSRYATSIAVDKAGRGLAPKDIWINNNTSLDSGSDSAPYEFVFVEATSDCADLHVVNNLLVAPVCERAYVIRAVGAVGVVVMSNLLTMDKVFIENFTVPQSPSSLLGYRVRSTVAGIVDCGIDRVGLVYDDVEGKLRPIGVAGPKKWDIGAFEYGDAPAPPTRLRFE